MTKKTGPDPTTFPKPSALYGTWVERRGPGQEFKVHSSRKGVKNTVGNYADGTLGVRPRTTGGYYQHDYALAVDVYVYLWDWDNAEWVEQFMLKQGTYREDHPFFTDKKELQKIVPASQDELDEAIASILGGAVT